MLRLPLYLLYSAHARTSARVRCLSFFLSPEFLFIATVARDTWRSISSSRRSLPRSIPPRPVLRLFFLLRR
jgi:hypothetical protein